VKNYGTNVLTSIPVSYSVNGGASVSATFTPSGSGLLPGATAQYTFTTPAIVTGGSFNICAKTNISTDVYTQNDEKCKNIVPTPANINVGIIEIFADPALNDTTRQSFNTKCTIKLINFGLNTITSIPLQYKLGTIITANETWTGSISTGDTLTYSFTTTYHSPIGNYQLCALAAVPGDSYSSDNEKCKSYIGISDVGINSSNGLGFTVNQNKPNPAFGKVNIDFSIPKAGSIKFELRNPLGQVVISNENDYSFGTNTIVVDASQLSNGVYYYTVIFEGSRITRKMIVNQ
jgi:hypothetical protein